MARLFTICALMMLAALPARSEEIVLGLSRDEVDITATFDGSDILIFGAIKRDSPAPEIGDLGIIVTVAGPNVPVTVRRKDRRLGIWVNTDSVEIDVAPSFYAVATNRPLPEILNAETDATTMISTARAIQANGSPDATAAYTDALIRIRQDVGLYQTLPEGVWVRDDTLFRALITLPANLTEGNYRAEIFLTRGGRIVDTYETEIPVQKVGMERWLYNLAHENAIIYGLMSLAIAIAAGWGASAVFTLFRR